MSAVASRSVAVRGSPDEPAPSDSPSGFPRGLVSAGCERDASGFLVAPASAMGEPGQLWLNESPSASVPEFSAALRAGTYSRPFVIDHEGVRRLHFGMAHIQSEMSLADPDSLCAVYTQAMMSFLLFRSRPLHILMVGLGGGSLTKFCHRHLPRARITVLEIDPDVVALSRLFHVPEPDARLSVVLTDAGDYVPRMTHCVDVILLDAYDRQGLARRLLPQTFHDELRDRLNHGGVLVMNLVGAERLCESQVCQLADAFGAPPLVLEVPGEDNRVVFAFRADEFRPDWAAVENRALVLAQRHPIPFPRFAMELRSRYETCSPVARR